MEHIFALLRLPAIPDWPALERLGFEAEAIGFHLSAHPLDAYAQVLRRVDAVPLARVQERAQAAPGRAKLAGIVVGEKQRITRNGSRMAWIRLSDTTGSAEVTVFSEVLTRARDLLTAGSPVLVTADLRLDADALRVTAHDVVSLDEAARDAGAGIRIWLARTESVAHIRALLDREGRGKGRVILVPRTDGAREIEIALPGGFNVSPRLAQALKVMPGVERIEDL